MANRYPLIVDTTDSNKIKEIPEGDNLYLSGNNITGVGTVTATGLVSGTLAISGTANFTGTAVESANGYTIGGTNVQNTISWNNLLDQPIIPETLTDLNISDGLPGQFLTTDGNSNFSFATVAPGSSVTSFTDLDDVPVSYTGQSLKVVRVNSGESGLEFATITTEITDSAIIAALGYTPYDASNPDGFISTILSTDITDALGYTPYNGVTNPLGFINNSTGVVNALGYTPYNSSNPDGYINDSVGIVSALGYTPYSNANPNGYITGITGTNVIDALGYTPYSNANPDGYITSISSSDVTTALGYTPYNGATNPNGYLSTESDTLALVTGRGATTSTPVTFSGGITTSSIAFTATGAFSIDGASGSTLTLGGTSNLILRDFGGGIELQASIIPNSGFSYDLGSAGFPFGNGHFGSTLTSADFATNAASSSFTLAGNLDITPGSANGVVRLTRGGFGLAPITTTNRNSLSNIQTGYVIFNSTTNQYQGYTGSRGGAGAGWVNLWHGEPGSQPASPYPGQIAIADGSTWDPRGDGAEAMMVYIRGGWVEFAA